MNLRRLIFLTENAMEYLHNGFCLDTPSGTFPLSTDSMLLASFVRLPKSAQVLDLGAGCGTLGLLLCAKDRSCHVVGLELDENSHLAALENISRNQLSDRLSSICCDLRSIPGSVKAGQFTTCVSNPPYFSGGPVSQSTPLARHESACAPEELFAAADHALRYGGDFYLVHKPERLAQLCACAARHHLEPKRLCLVRHREGGPIALILLACRKGGKPGLIIEELSLFDAGGDPTQAYKDIYHI